MAYIKQTWVDGVTPLDAEHMTHIEDGIAAAHEALANLPENPDTPDIPAGVTVDATLTQSGAAADAAVVGEKFGQLSEEIAKNSGIVTLVNKFDKTSVKSGYYLVNGTDTQSSKPERVISDFIEVEFGKNYTFAFTLSVHGINNVFRTVEAYDAEKNYLGNTDNFILWESAHPEQLDEDIATIKIVNREVKYIRYQLIEASLATAMMVEGDAYPSEYHAYNVPFTVDVKPLGDFQLSQVREMINSVHNLLYGKIASFTGDSICAGGGNNGVGYAEIIGELNGMTVENISVNGGRITPVTGKFCISQSVNDMRTDADFVILEGGVNDMAMDNLGTISNNFNATLDTTTFCGAFEQMIKDAIARFPGKKIGYIAVHRLKQWAPDEYNTDFPNTGYYEAAIKICKKWGIPVCDLTTCCPSLFENADLKQMYTGNADGWHPNEEGYRKYYVPKIEAWMKTL